MYFLPTLSFLRLLNTLGLSLYKVLSGEIVLHCCSQPPRPPHPVPLSLSLSIFRTGGFPQLSAGQVLLPMMLASLLATVNGGKYSLGSEAFS